MTFQNTYRLLFTVLLNDQRRVSHPIIIVVSSPRQSSHMLLQRASELSGNRVCNINISRSHPGRTADALETTTTRWPVLTRLVSSSIDCDL